jgi:hypothetical protein
MQIAPSLGMTKCPVPRPEKRNAGIAKNNLTGEELESLNRIVTAYLEFAELQAMNRKPMTMAAWIAKLDDFLRLSDREVLNHAGSISHDAMMKRVESEYRLYQQKQINEASKVERDMKDLENKIKISRRKK